MAKNVFVFGLDDFNRKKMESIGRPEEFRFYGLLRPEALTGAKEYRFGALLAAADRQLSLFKGRVDGIVSFRDFPANLLQPILARKRALHGAPLQSVARCEHKYWSRLLQSQAIREHVPRFQAFDPFDEASVRGIRLEYPFWIKPVVSYAGYLALRVENEDQLLGHLRRIRAGISRYAQPFAEAWARLDPPVGADHVDGRWCIAEEPVRGEQCTVEGYVFQGEAKTYGVVDSHRMRNGISFRSYEYPSRLPEHVKRRIASATRTVMEHVGYDNAAFNVEWMWDPQTDALRVLEINSRISQSHSDLFEKVNGCSNHEVPVELSVGNEPNIRGRRGAYDVAAKVFFRHTQDDVVTRVPTDEEVRRIEERMPGTTVHLEVHEGMRLSQILDQDDYSFRLGYAYIGASDRQELLEKSRQVESGLRFEFEEARAAPEAYAARR